MECLIQNRAEYSQSEVGCLRSTRLGPKLAVNWMLGLSPEFLSNQDSELNDKARPQARQSIKRRGFSTGIWFSDRVIFGGLRHGVSSEAGTWVDA